MPQLVKGGKWVFGWTIVGANGKIPIPPEAFREYKLQLGEDVFFIKGSQASGGFSIGRTKRLAQSNIDVGLRPLGQGVIDPSQQGTHPPNLGLNPGDRLLVVRGSGLALVFLQRGRIYEEALKHPELDTFTV